MSLCRRAAEGVSPYGGRVWFALVLQPAVEDIRFVFKAPSTRVPARVAAQRDKVSAMDKEPSTRVPARVAAIRTGTRRTPLRSFNPRTRACCSGHPGGSRTPGPSFNPRTRACCSCKNAQSARLMHGLLCAS